jgi:hypothetical protein
MLEEGTINNTFKRYIKNALIILVGTTLGALMYMNVAGKETLLQPIIISLVYNTLVSLLFIYIWRAIMQNAREYVVHFYLGATGFRLITAMFVILAYCLTEDIRTQKIQFAVVFCIYYFIMLLFDTLYFIKIEGKAKKQDETH